MKRQLGLSEMVQQQTARASRRATRGALGFWAWSNVAAAGSGDPRRARRGRETRAERTKRGRRGSTLLIVIALLGMLTLLGMLYFTFATQEQANATYFADAVKQVDDPGDDIDAIFDAALRQLIQGANYPEKNSALWGGRHSLISNMLGRDLQPFNGAGVNVHRLSSGQLVVDQTRSGTANGDQSLLELNDSPAARTLVERLVQTFPAPDVDYTAPDHNNAYLAYQSFTWKTSTNPATGYRVIKPSFHRPEFLRNNSGQPITDWETTSGGGGVPFSTQGRLFRPHPDHLYVPRPGQVIPVPVRRFLSDYNPADAGDIANLPPLRGFPFTKVTTLPGTVPPTVQHRQQGVWSLTTLPATATIPPYEFDVDNDNDGIPDSIWMDLDLSVQRRPSDGAAYIPLVAFMVQDLDALFNLAAAGNLSGDTRTAATTDFGNGGDISRSSMGLSPSEINLLWGLDTLPSEATSLNDHTRYFHAPTTSRHLANMEWWWLNKGRVEYVTPTQVRQFHVGRYGDAIRVVGSGGVLSVAGAGPVIGVQMSNSNLFPFPGIWNVDDNLNNNEGDPISAVSQTLPYRHPLALGGMGRFWSGTNPKQLNLYQALGVGDLNRWLQYVGTGVGYDGTSATASVAWFTPFSRALMVNPVVGANFVATEDLNGNGSLDAGEDILIPNGVLDTAVLQNDASELTLDSKYLRRPDDEALDARDTLFLFMSPSDRARVRATSRIQDLMPGNFTPNSSNFYQLEVAKRFTTASWDVKQFGLPRFIGGTGADNQPGVASQDDNLDGVVDDENERGWPGSDDDRAWEYNVDLDGNGKLEFPPQFNAPANFQPSLPENAYQPKDPFRPQLRRLLTVEFGNATNRLNPLRLNINEFLDVDHYPGIATDPVNHPLKYRPLTPHSTDSTLTTLPAVSPLPAFPPTTEGQKEFWARRDRQQMARDIYVLLYTFCGGNDAVNVTKVPGNTAYPGIVRRQMAQFAVNFVDSLDRDNVMTAFEYDDNLVDGWNLDDDFTTDDAGTLPASSRRFVVYGVEAQELTISEALWAFQDKLAVGNDVPLTPFDESANKHHFLQVELRCSNPTPVDLFHNDSNAFNRGVWFIHRDDNGNGKLDGTENRVTFLNGTYVPGAMVPAAPPVPIQPGSLFTIASADVSPVASASLYVDTAGTAGAELVAPNKVGAYPATPGYADLDLNHFSHAGFVALQKGVAGDLLSRNANEDLNSNGILDPGEDVNSNGILDLGFEPALATTTVNLRLERRLNPALVRLSLLVNPPQVVDQFSVARQSLGLAKNDTPAQAATKLGAKASRERSQPLNAEDFADSTGVGPSVLKNSLGRNNTNLPAATFFNLFQPHFDRDFASVIELFNVPLEGPERLTQIMVNSRRPANLVDSAGLPVGQLQFGGPFTFGGAVLMQSEDRDGNDLLLTTSEDTDNDGVLDVAEDLNSNGILDPGEDLNSNGILDPAEDLNSNGRIDFEDFNLNGVLDAHPYHFHRLLSLVEVPTRTHRQLGDALKVNLNTVRDPRVIAGLIDDRQVVGSPERTGVDIGGNGTSNPPNGIIETGLPSLDIALATDFVEDSGGMGIRRDWWYQFLIARDGLDPTTSLALPIAGSSRPFHDLGYLRYDQEFGAQASIEDTILRELPGGTKYTGTQPGKGKKGKGKGKGKSGGGTGTAGPSDGRRLFELVTENELVGNYATAPDQSIDPVAPPDPLMRHRLLSKIIGNTTTRSNVFVVHATIGMFACKENADGSVRIGGQMDVDGDGSPDTHRAIFIVDRSAVEEAYDKASGTFDWKKLLLAKQRIN